MEDMSNVMRNPDNAEMASVNLTGEPAPTTPVVTETPGTNYRSLGSTIPENLTLDDIKVTGPVIPNMEKVAKAAGHSIDPAKLQPEGRFVSKPEEPVEEKKGQRIISPKQAKAEGINVDGAEHIDINAEAARRMAEQQAQAQKASDDQLAAMLQGTLDYEASRNQRLDNTLNADEDTRRELLGNTPINPGVDSKQTTEKERRRTDRQSTNPEVDPYELLPSYSEEDIKDETEKEPEAEEAEPDLTDANYVRNLETVTDKEPAKGYAVERIREANVTVVRTRSDKTQGNLGNQAFENALNRYKRDNFGKVTVPLVNSGFMADVVGTGVVDLQNLYINVDQNTSPYDYRLEQMATVIRNVVGTNPKVNPNNLRNLIHYRDFDMLAFSHVCATLKTVETVANCTECGRPFHITSNPVNLLLNMDEIYDRRVAIENASNIEENSLMTASQLVTTEGGIEVTLSHPSYAEMVRCIRGFQDFSQNLTEADRRRFESMLELLYMVRKVRLPDGTQSNNIYQHYRALMLLTQQDLDLVNATAEKMRKDVITPKFGIREVECPHCHRIVKNIPFEDIVELLFFHLSVSALLNPTNDQKPSEEQSGQET